VINDVVDQQSSMYRYGGYAGQAVNIGLMFANPAAMAPEFKSSGNITPLKTYNLHFDDLGAV
jgi:hypothetical protein